MALPRPVNKLRDSFARSYFLLCQLFVRCADKKKQKVTKCPGRAEPFRFIPRQPPVCSKPWAVPPSSPSGPPGLFFSRKHAKALPRSSRKGEGLVRLWRRARRAFRAYSVLWARTTSAPLSRSTMRVSPGDTWSAMICRPMRVSTVCCTYRRRGRAPKAGS